MPRFTAGRGRSGAVCTAAMSNDTSDRHAGSRARVRSDPSTSPSATSPRIYCRLTSNEYTPLMLAVFVACHSREAFGPDEPCAQHSHTFPVDTSTIGRYA